MVYFAKLEFTILVCFIVFHIKNDFFLCFRLFFLFFILWNENNFVPLQSQNDKAFFKRLKQHYSLT